MGGGGTLTTVKIRIGAFLPINPSPTTLCVCHSGFLIVSEYFPDDWCINTCTIAYWLQAPQTVPELRIDELRGCHNLELNPSA